MCVRTIHQNVKLIVENAKLGAITDNELKTYKHCMAKMLCNPPSTECFMNDDCTSCQGHTEIRKIIS